MEASLEAARSWAKTARDLCSLELFESGPTVLLTTRPDDTHHFRRTQVRLAPLKISLCHDLLDTPAGGEVLRLEEVCGRTHTIHVHEGKILLTPGLSDIDYDFDSLVCPLGLGQVVRDPKSQYMTFLILSAAWIEQVFGSRQAAVFSPMQELGDEVLEVFPGPEEHPQPEIDPWAGSRLLEDANRVTQGSRRSDYGLARENHERIARLWEPILGCTVTPEQVILCMIQVKAARICNSPDHRDSWLDIAGYAAVKEKMERGE